MITEERKQYKRQWAIDNRPKLAEQARVRNASRLRFLASVKLTAGCIDCGYNKYPEALEFDHVRGTKSFYLSQCAARGLKLVIEEVMKCDVRCANCHAVRHRNRL